MMTPEAESLKIKQKLKPMNKAMLATHTFNNIISIFSGKANKLMKNNSFFGFQTKEGGNQKIRML